MKKIISTLLTTIILSNIYGQKIETVYLDKNDSTKSCYSIIYPPKLPWKGYIFLIPGFGEYAENVLLQSDLPNQLSLNGILTIIPTFSDGNLSFGVDSLSQQSFNEILEDVTSKHKLIDTKFYVGGFSIGGSCAIKYSEIANKENYKIKPSAVFAIDPPLDFERYYNSCLRNIRLSVTSEASQEFIYMKERLEKEMNGTPKTSLLNYYKVSPYSFTDTNQTAIKNIINTPLRIYSEPDINWWLKERNSDFSAMNVLDASAMINELNRLGNTKATLITTQNKGFRKPDNRRHPHSWSIVDNNELIIWLLNQ